MSDFNWTPSYRTEVEDQYAVKEARFGDGYRQTSPDGVNPVAEVWNLVFENIPLATGQAIRAFLKGKAGTSFTWTNPDGVEKRYTLRGAVAMPRVGPTTVNLSCTFEEFFGS